MIGNMGISPEQLLTIKGFLKHFLYCTQDFVPVWREHFQKRYLLAKVILDNMEDRVTEINSSIGMDFINEIEIEISYKKKLFDLYLYLMKEMNYFLMENL